MLLMLEIACFVFLIKKNISSVTGGVPSLEKHTQKSKHACGQNGRKSDSIS